MSLFHPSEARLSSTRSVIRQLASKGAVYWLTVFLTVSAGLYIGHWISDARLWLQWRYKASHAIQSLTHRVPIAKYTSVVTIGSNEYWRDGLSARVPIRRGYLARLVRAIAQGDPFLIALDFDMRSPQPDGSIVEFPDFETETRDLIRQLRETAGAHHIVLPRTIWNAAGHRYRIDSDVWNLEPDLLKRPNVHSGYIALPPDLRQIPLAVPLVNASEPLDSFSLAIARARGESVTDELIREGGRENLPFASYIPEHAFPVRSASDVLAADPTTLKTWFDGRLVLIGGDWNVLADQRGSRVDLYLSPAGTMPGVFVHANFVEALLDQRTYEAAPEWFVASLEVILVLVCIIALALDLKTRTKVTTWTLVLLALIAVNFFALHNLGRFFDFFVPLVVIIAHVAYEQINEWRHHAHAHRRCSARLSQALLAALGSTAVLICTGESRATLLAVWAGNSDCPPGLSQLAQASPGGSGSSGQTNPGSGQPAPNGAGRDINPMGDPVMKPDREVVDPLSTGGAKRGPTPIARTTDPMGDPVVEEGVDSADPTKPGGPRRDREPVDRAIDPMGDPVVRDDVPSADVTKPGGTRLREGD